MAATNISLKDWLLGWIVANPNGVGTGSVGIPAVTLVDTTGSATVGANVNIAAVADVPVVAATAPVPVGFYNPTGGALLDPTLPAQVVGSVASGAADSGNPVKFGAVYNATLPTISTGQRVDAQADLSGNIRVTLAAATSTPNDGIVNSSLSGVTSPTSQTGARPLLIAPVAFNGTSWDRVRNAGTAGTGLLVENGPYSRGRVTADGRIKSSAGFIHTISIAPLTATPTAGLLTVYDNTAESGTVVYAEWIFATTPGHTVTLDIPCATGIYVGFDGALANVQVTVAYR